MVPSFNKYSGQNRWKTLSKYYHYEIAKIYNNKQNTTANVNTTKWKQLINYDYTISNIKFFKTLLKNDDQAFYITDTIDIDDFIKETDGSIHYPYKTKNPNYDEVKRTAISYTKGQVYSLGKYNALSNTKLFEDFIKYLQSKRVNVILFLPPYNPIIYDLLIKNEKYKYIKIAEQYINDFAIQHNIDVKGSYNPHKYGFKNKNFFDGMHGHDGVAEKIFE